jgi:hypothetical protein
LICDQFVDYLDSGGLFSAYQSGFRKFCSNALTNLGVDRLGFLISVLLDFSKAFDSMLHDLLPLNLRFKFGLSSTACWLFGCFLGPRTQN